MPIRSHRRAAAAAAAAPAAMSHTPPEEEVLFLALHHLHTHDASPPVARALRSLEAALAALHKLPTAADYTGATRVLSYPQCVARYPHIPPCYLRDALRARLPPSAPPTLLATGRHATLPPAARRRPRPALAAARRLLRPDARSIPLLLEQQRYLPVSTPVHRATFTLLPAAFRRQKRLVGHHLPVFTTLFDQTSRFVITGSDDHHLKIWSADTGYLQHTLRGHDSDITEIAKHPTRPIMVSASNDTTIRVWHIRTGAALHVLDGGAKEVNVVMFSPCPDRPYVVSGGADGSVRLWNADNFHAGCIRIPIPQRPVPRPTPAGLFTDTTHIAPATPAPGTPPSAPPAAAPASAAAPTPMTSGAYAHSSAQRSIQTGSTPNDNPTRAPEPRHNVANSMVSSSPTYEVLSVAFNAGATRLAVSGTDCVAHLYAVESPATADSFFPQLRHLTSLRGHSEHIIQVLFSRSGDSIVTACRDGTARIWNRVKARLPVGRKRKQSVAGMGSWSSVVLDCRSPIQADARSALSVGASGSACGSIAPRLRRASFPVSVGAAMWSLTDKYVFTASSDTKIRVWHADTGKLARVLEAHEREVYVMDCHPMDSRILLSAGYDGKVFLWDIETGNQLKTFSISDEPSAGVVQPSITRKWTSIADGQFSPDGLSFVVADTSGALTIFGTGSGESTALAPEEQFFSDDYAPYRRDAENRAIDERSGLLLHLKEKGRLCNKELRPHPPELQPNLPLPNLGKSEDLDGSESMYGTTYGTASLNSAQNQNRNALILRAREFRENQEKEERRLLREAREARRRLVIEREKKALEKDLEPAYLALRDFEVQDSECDDSDADFDGDEEGVSGTSDSSSSSDEDEESRDESESRRRRMRNRKRVSTRSAPRKSTDLRKRTGLRRLRRKSEKKDEAAADSGESDGKAADDSDEYEIGSQDNDSDSSLSSGERRRTRRRNAAVLGKAEEDFAEEQNVPITRSAVAQGSRYGRISPSVSRPNAPIPDGPRLGGASIKNGQRRMRIRIQTGGASEPVSMPLLTSTSLRQHLNGRDAESQPVPNVTAATDINRLGANSCASQERRGHPSDAAGIVGVHTPMNPSFTSERKEDRGGSNRTSKPLEDHQGDTASCIRPRPSGEDIQEQGRAAPMHENNLQHMSSQEKSPRTQKALNSPVDFRMKNEMNGALNDVTRLTKVEGLEKSVLSDSPVRLSRKKWRARTRNGTAKEPAENVATPVIDIDELADRELEILEEQCLRKHRKRRKKAHQDRSEGEQTSEDGDEMDVRKTEKEEEKDAPKRLKNQRKRSTRGNGVLPAKDRAGAGNEGISFGASAWLRSSSNRYTYVPQLGDDVMYFPQGHVAAMAFSKSVGLDPLAGRVHQKKGGSELLDGNSFGREATPVRFQICDVSYEFPVLMAAPRPRSITAKAKARENAVKKKIIVVLTLRLVSGMRRRGGQSDLFILPYYPVDAPEYLVLSSRVESALGRSWKAEDRFRILFLNESRAWQYYTGTIRSVKPSIRTVMWNTVEVEYDNEGDKEKGSNEFVSPWELEPFDLLQGAKEGLPQFTQMIRSSSVEPGLFPVVARELEAIRSMESNWIAQLSWLDTVDSLAAMPGYCDKVPYPIDFNTVLVRLCTGYYRHFCSFLHDISLLKSNAIRFHTSQSQMGRLAVRVFTRIADTAERIRVQFVASLMPVPHTHNPNHVAGLPGTSRSIRPRPANADMSGSVATMVGQFGASNGARQFPVPVNPRQSNSGFAVPSHHTHEGAGQQAVAAIPGQRVWTSMRSSQGNPALQPLYANLALGVSLPPALPGMATSGITTRGSGRASRATARTQNIRYNTAQVQQANAGNGNRGYNNTSAAPATGTTASMPVATASHGVSSPFASPQITSAAQPQQTQLMMATNSSHTHMTPRALPRRIAPSSSRSHPRVVMKRAAQPVTGMPVHVIPTSETPVAATTRVFAPSGVVSASQDAGLVHGAVGASMSITQPSPHGALSRQNNRAVADGGTHSWGGSMEGAGGMFPLQASTSDSHLPVPIQQTGRSRSPISPSAGFGERGTAGVRQQAVSGVVGAGAAYHEHSTVSIVAAKSTMSCGGADVELQAATAESVEVPTLRPRKTR